MGNKFAKPTLVNPEDVQKVNIPMPAKITTGIGLGNNQAVMIAASEDNKIVISFTKDQKDQGSIEITDREAFSLLKSLELTLMNRNG